MPLTKPFGGKDDGRPSTGPNSATPGAFPSEGTFQQKIDYLKGKKQAGKGNKDKINRRLVKLRTQKWGEGIKNKPPASPYDSLYHSQVGAAETARNNSYLGSALQESDVNNYFGFAESATSNPLSLANQLRKAWEIDRRGTTTSLAAQGQLYSGALGNALNRDDTEFVEAEDAAKRDWQQQLAEITADREGSQQSYVDAIMAAEEGAIDRALQKPPEDAPPPPDFVGKYKENLRDRMGQVKKRSRRKVKDIRSKDLSKKKTRKRISRVRKQKKTRLKGLQGQLQDIPDQYAE